MGAEALTARGAAAARGPPAADATGPPANFFLEFSLQTGDEVLVWGDLA